MKITEKLTGHTERTTPHRPNPAIGFEEWLNTPMHQQAQNEYYWIHQKELQPSALAFNPLNPPKTIQLATPVISCDEHTQEGHDLENTPLQAGIDHDNNQKGLTSENPIKNQYPITPKTSNVAPSCHRQIATTIEKEKAIKDDIRMDKPIKTTSYQPFRSHESLKKHHLFIQNSEAELSLNLHPLSANEQKKFIKTIKTLMKQKGVTLNKIIINGVQK